MRVPVVRVLDVGVLVRHRLVDVLLLVAFGDVEPRAQRHERRPGGERDARPLVEDDERDCGADEGRGGEARARARRSHVAECEDEQHQTHAVAEEAEDEPDVLR